MNPRLVGALWVIVMVAVIVTLDITFLRGSVDAIPRLFVNIGIVVVFLGAFWLLVWRRRKH